MDTNELPNETASKEVKQLVKDGVISLTPDVINRLRVKYNDDNVVDAIMEFFADRRKKISKVANVFMNAFEKKYRNDFYTISLSKFLKRALKYKKKYSLSDDEFDEIKRIFETRLFNSSSSLSKNTVVYPNTTLSRVIGYPITESTDPITTSNADDYPNLQEILKLYQMYRSLHSYIIIQTMTYTDLSTEAITGLFNINFHDVNRYVHPILAALFLPKISSVEERMLYANIAGIINTRYNRERIITKPDYELLYSMIVDPNDVVCDLNSPLKDVRTRAEVQVFLWNNVYNLRNGKYYEADTVNFIVNIDRCKISNSDNPDVLLLSDEGVLLRRLFAIFSFRPIVIQTQPLFGAIINNPLSLPVNVNAVTSIPYITYKLPLINTTTNYHLNQANNMVQFYMENGTYVPKVTQILYARGIIVFYVPRKSASLPINYANPQGSPLNITQLAVSTQNYQTVNRMDMDYDPSITITDRSSGVNTVFNLRSVIAIELLNNNNIVIGYNTFLYEINGRVLLYKPRVANIVTNNNLAITSVNPLEAIAVIRQLGTVFVYATSE